MTKNLSVPQRAQVNKLVQSAREPVFKCAVTEARNKEAARQHLFAIKLALSKQAQ